MMIKKLIFLIAVVVIAFGCNDDSRGYIVSVGDKAPDIELLMPDSSRMMLSDLRGKVVMLQFTATWCGVCLEEMPHIESEIWQKLKTNDDFRLYGVMYKQNKDDVKQMINLTSVTYPLVLDDDGSRFHKYASKGAGVTRNVIIDKDGNIVFLTRLYTEKEFSQMVKIINELVE